MRCRKLLMALILPWFGCLSVPVEECPPEHVLQLLEDGTQCVRRSQLGVAQIDCEQPFEVPVRRDGVWACIEEPVDVFKVAPVDDLKRAELEAIREGFRFAMDSPDPDVVLRDLFANSDTLLAAIALLEYLPAALYIVSWGRNVGYVDHFGNCRCEITGRATFCNGDETITPLSVELLREFRKSPTGPDCVETQFNVPHVRTINADQLELLAPAACILAAYRPVSDHRRLGRPDIASWYHEAWGECAP